MANPKKEFYITTSIPYMNAVPHIGHALEFVQADALARYYKAQGENVFLLTGTDEHGRKIQEAAQAAHETPQEYVDALSGKWKTMMDELGVGYDAFIRTSSRQHKQVVLDILQKLKANSDIYKGKYEGLYCIGCEAFLREAEMQDGRCIIHQKEPQHVYEENYFFTFSKYAKQIEKLIREDSIRILPAYRKTEILNLFSDEGIKDISISRPVQHTQWGITMPYDESQTVYVWADALINYLSGAGYGTPDFAQRWPADIQVIGKDIARFHLMMWPALLLALKLEMPKSIYIHGHVMVEGQKISKSLGNGIDPLVIAKTFGADGLRYLLLREIASGNDGDFSYGQFTARYTADLQNGLGNLVSRVSTIGQSHKDLFAGMEIHADFAEEHKMAFENYGLAMGNFELHTALAHAFTLVADSNKLMEETELWKKVKEDAEGSKAVMQKLAVNLYAAGIMLLPFMPNVAERIFSVLGVEHDTHFPKDVSFTKPEQPIFQKLESRK